MQHVPRKWLLICNAALAGIAAIFIILYLIRNIFNIPLHVQEHWGISSVVATVATVYLVYTVFLYPFVSKRYTWITSIISFALAAIMLSTVIDASGNINIVYRLAYAAIVFLMAMTGAFAPLTAIILTWVVLVLTISGSAGTTAAPLSFNILIDIIVTLSGLAGWLTFRHHYINTKTQAEIQLTHLLKEEQFKSNIVIESITDGVIITDTKGTVQVINDSAATMLGWEQKEALRLDYRSLLQPFQERSNDNTKGTEETAITICARTQKPTQKVSLILTKSQQRTYVDIVASPILETRKDEGRVCIGVIAILRNVDKQKREEAQRSEFISTASHEMRTPVAAIQGFIELALNEKVATIDDKARGYLVKAHEASKHLGRLFQDLLTASKSEDGRLTNNPTIIEVGEVLSQLVDHARFPAEKKGLKVIFETTQSTERAIAPLLYIHADTERFREVVTNLIDNAIKYTEHGMITVGASLKEKTVIIRVSDTGMGISAEDIPHLFQKFYRTDNSATREIGGTGLGLYISKQIVEMMGGQIWVESTPGAGSTFYIELPRVSPETVIKQNGS